MYNVFVSNHRNVLQCAGVSIGVRGQHDFAEEAEVEAVIDVHSLDQLRLAFQQALNKLYHLYVARLFTLSTMVGAKKAALPYLF